MTTPINISPGDVTTSLGCRLQLDVRQTLDSGLDPIPVNTSAFTVDPYVIVDGIPVGDGAGARIVTRAGVDDLTQVLAPIDPDTLFPDAHAHWRPRLADLDPPADGGRRWWPIGGVHDADHARMSLYTIAGATGAGLYGVGAPYVDVGYTYRGAQGRTMSRPAMIFDNSTARAKIDPEASFDQVTLAVTVVLHASAQQYYGIFEAQQVYDPSSSSPVGEPLVLRYTHGRLDLYQDENRVLSHETNKPSAYPTILLISLDTDAGLGRMMCIDQTRTTRQFNITDMDFVSLLGSVGALGQGIAGSPYRYGADMDLLDMAIWSHAMDWPELESNAGLLQLAYT